MIALCDIGPPRERIASQQVLFILCSSTVSSRIFGTSFGDVLLDNVANNQIRAANLNWGSTFNVRISNAIGKHRRDVGCDGAAIGWL
jgi:hypothetical protein